MILRDQRFLWPRTRDCAMSLNSLGFFSLYKLALIIQAETSPGCTTISLVRETISDGCPTDKLLSSTV